MRAPIRRTLAWSLTALLLVTSLPYLAQAATAALVATPSNLDLGTVQKGKIAGLPVKVTNTSDATITISHSTITADYKLDIWTEGSCYDTVEPGRFCGFMVYAGGDVPGTYDSLIRIYSDDATSPLRIEVHLVVPETPDAGAPSMGHPPTNQELVRVWPASRRKVRYLWSWTATDDKGVTGFTTQVRSQGQPWRTVVTPSVPVEIGGGQKLPITIPTDTPVSLRTRAYDAAGNTSAWATSTRIVGMRNIRKGVSRLTGKWRNVGHKDGAYEHDLVVTRQPGATASITATARSISLIGRRCSQCAFLKVFDESGDTGVILRSDKITDLVVLYTRAWPDIATRTVTVEALPQLPWRPTIALDAWVVMR